MSQEVHTTPSGCSNSDLRDQILVIFLADVTKKVVHHTMLCFPSATAPRPMPGEREIRKLSFRLSAVYCYYKVRQGKVNEV